MLQGIVPILLTPFDAHGRIDTESLQYLIDFNIGAGVHGLGVALGSEIFKFTEEERNIVIRTVVAHVAGRVPVVVNTGATGTDLAVHYSRMAAEAGVNVLMVAPPFFMPVSPAEIVDYCVAIGGATELPVILQDIPQAPISSSLATTIADRVETVVAIKVEAPPVVPRVASMAEAVADRLTVFGGAGGAYFIEELRRGARGTMPFASQPYDFVEVWRHFDSGDVTGAARHFNDRILAVARLAALAGDLGYYVHKQLLVRRGIFPNANVRAPTVAPDPTTQQEIDMVLAGL